MLFHFHRRIKYNAFLIEILMDWPLQTDEDAVDNIKKVYIEERNLLYNTNSRFPVKRRNSIALIRYQYFEHV